MNLDDQEAMRLYRTLLRSRARSDSPLTVSARRAMLVHALRRKGLDLPEEKILPVAVPSEPVDTLGRI